MTARYIMIGGFLGAGKTTAMSALGNWLKARDLTCGLITNDQASGLVDSVLLRERGFAVEEIAGGCFCCRFDSLKKAADRLTTAVAPQVFLAEPVGSCTDLVATVNIPLKRLYGDEYVISPLSVLIDPKRLQKRLGLIPGRPFSKKVQYIFDKQLEEADILVLNKIDAHPLTEIDALRRELKDRWPKKRVVTVSALTGAGLDDWFEGLLAEEAVESPTMELDYDLYAQGEAELGWLNLSLDLQFKSPVDGNEWLNRFASAVKMEIKRCNALIAHCKITLSNFNHQSDIAALSIVDSEGGIDPRNRMRDPLESGLLLVNLRAELMPGDEAQLFSLAIERALLSSTPQGTMQKQLNHSFFRPAPPVPTHRFSVGLND